MSIINHTVKISFKDVVDYLNKKAYHIPNSIIINVCSIDAIKPNCLIFYNKNDRLHLSLQEEVNIKTCLVLVKNQAFLPIGTPCIITSNPRLDFAKILKEFYSEKPKPGIHKTAVIANNVKLPGSVSVGKYTVIEENVEIGENTIIENNVTIKSGTIIGQHVLIKNGVILGDEGYGFEFDNKVPIRIKHVGGLVIGDYVEIGNNCIVKKGTIDNTIIESHVKINDLTNIAHNVRIHTRTIIAGGQISGSVIIGKDCWIAPGVVIQNKVKIGNGALVGTGSVVVHDVPDKVVVYGNPATVIRNR